MDNRRVDIVGYFNTHQMLVTGTKQAFEAMINEVAVNKKLGVSRATVTNWKKYLHDGRVSLDKMEEMLLKYGATIKSDKIWKI